MGDLRAFSRLEVAVARLIVECEMRAARQLTALLAAFQVLLRYSHLPRSRQHQPGHICMSTGEVGLGRASESYMSFPTIE